LGVYRATKAAIRNFAGSWALVAAALFLDSDDTSFMTGREVFVDGGVAQV
jgi:NAD(P)-dependent dehydrogenase (short-subunit alcohol dehydrogenase family)